MAKRQGYRPSRGRSGANAVSVSECLTVVYTILPILMITADPRFARISTDPRFRLPSKKHTHVAIDQRFSRMLRDDDFSQKATVDRYGRKIAKGSGRKELERFYNLEEQDEEGDHRRSVDEDEQDDSSDNKDEEDIVERTLIKAGKPYDPARDGGFSTSDDETSSSDEEDDDDEAVLGEDGHQYPGVQVGQTTDVPMGEISSRIAVVNLDWDNIRAVDLMAVFSSFCPPDGRLQLVAIYPSEFGKERLAREEVEGPPREIFADRHHESDGGNSSSEENEEEADEDEKIKESLLQEDKGEEFDNTKLRRYQLERLRYYYAVLTLSSAEAAKALYDATDGTEYLTTANFFDLRFVPDGVSFEGDRVRDECSSIPDDYKPNNFVTDALQHSKVKLTWDAEDNVRKEMVKKAFSGSRRDIEDNDLKAYLGSDSSEDEAVDDDDDGGMFGVPGQASNETKVSKKEQERQRLRAALGLETAPTTSRAEKADAPVGDMQITFTSGLSGPSNPAAAAPQEETTIEKYKRKEKERKQKHREKVTAARDDGGKSVSTGAQDDATADSEEKNEDLGFDDPFFTSVPDDEGHLPSKSSKSTTISRKAERQRRRQEAEQKEAQTSRDRAELELLMLDDEQIFPSSSHLKSNPENNPTTTTDGEQQPDIEQGQGERFSHFDINEIARAEKKAAKKGRNKKKKSISVRHENPREHELDEHGRKKKDRRRSEVDNVDDVDGHGQRQGQDGFTVNTQDPRFQALFHQPEYAIDPTNPRYRDTKAMRTLLEEGRRKRKRGVDEDGEDVEGITGWENGGERQQETRAGKEGKKKGKRTRIAADDIHREDDDGGKNKKDDMDDLRRLAEKVKRKSTAAVSGTAPNASKQTLTKA